MRMRIVAGSSALLLAIVSRAGAQATVSGSVRDSAGRGISGAEIAIEALGRVTHSDDSGHYSLTNVLPGMRLVHVRRLGYQLVSVMVQVKDGENHQPDLVLARTIVVLDTVKTREQQAMHEDILLREFEDNRKIGLGHFITRAELARQEGRKMSDILEQLPGVKFIQGNGGVALIVSNRRQADINKPICYSKVYIDFALMNRKDDEGFDVNAVPPSVPAPEVESIEWFSGPAETPLRYNTLNANCGVLVLHTRRPP